MTKRFFVGAAFIFLSLVSLAQVEKADKYFAEHQYDQAIPIYEKVVKKGSDSTAIVNLAECYRITHQFDKAEVFYKQAAELYPNDADIQLKYGQILKSNQKVSQAKDVFVVYANRNPNDPTGKNYVLSCDRIKSWSIEIPGYQVENAEGLNSKVSDFSAVPYNDGVAFVTDRFTYMSDATGSDDQGFLAISFAEMTEDSTFKKAKPLKGNLNGHYHNGPVCFSEDLQEAYFTKVDYDRERGKEAVHKPQIYVSKYDGNKWGKAEYFTHNDPNHTYSHPALSPDGNTLFFVSDREGTKGGLDIFYCERQGGVWSEPKSLDVANTSGNEMFPTVHKDELYFSSDGLIGIGGLDIFKIKRAANGWGKPENLKDPLNSPRDDFGLVFANEQSGFFSSNRDGGKGGDDIYRFTVLNEKGEETEIAGIFLYSELDPAANQLIQLFDEDGNMIMETKTAEDGSFAFQGLESDVNYVIKVDENDPKLNDLSEIFLTNKEGKRIVSLSQPASGEFHFRALPAEKIVSLPALEEEDVELTFINIFGQIYDKLPGDYKEGIQVYLVDDSGEIVYKTFADEQGYFSFINQLSDQDYKIRLANDSSDLKMIFTNEQGEKTAKAEKIDEKHYVYLSKDVYVSKQTIIHGTVYAETPDEGSRFLKVFLINGKNEVVATTNTDEKGKFLFDNLQEHNTYKIRLDNDPDLKVELSEPGKTSVQARKIDDKHFVFLTRDLADPQTSSIFGKIYQELPGDYTGGMEVFLVNDDGEVIYTAVSDAEGNFIFENLPSDQNYAIKLKELDSEYKILMMDETGDPKEVLKQSQDGQFEYAAKEEESNSLFGKVYETLPGDYSAGMEVYLVDEDGKIVYTTNLDRDGNFNFENLPADHNYKVRLQQTGDDLNMIVLDEFGQVESRAKQNTEGDFEYERAENADKTGLFGNIFKELPGDFSGGLEVYLVDDDGNIVYTAITDKDGNFNFENLPPDHNYKIKLQNAEDDFNMVVLNSEGELKPAEETDNGYIIEKEVKRQLLGNIYQTLPGDVSKGIEVLLLDDDGNVVFRTVTDGNGNFSFRNLPAEKHFVVKLQSAEDDLNMVILNEYGEMLGSAQQTDEGIFETEIEEEPSGSESIFGQAYQELPGDFTAGMEVYLVDDEGNIVYTTTTDENGDFVFENLPSDKHYVIKFQEEDGDMKVMFKDDEGKQVGTASADANGDFDYAYLNSKKEYISLLTESDAVIKIVNDEDFIVFNLHFDYDGYNVQSDDRVELNKLASLMKKNPHVSVDIRAYADSKGTDEYNNKLTERRANEAKTYLINKGVASSRIIAKGYGESNPIAPNTLPDGSDNPKGRAKNRRAEVRIIRNN